MELLKTSLIPRQLNKIIFEAGMFALFEIKNVIVEL